MLNTIDLILLDQIQKAPNLEKKLISNFQFFDWKVEPYEIKIPRTDRL